MGSIRELQPDVDYRMPFNGLKDHELETVFRRLAASGQISRGEQRLALNDMESAAGTVIAGFIGGIVLFFLIFVLFLIWG